MVNLKKLPVEISEMDQIRSLHLETDSIQSAMSVDDPVHLTLKYTQVVALLLLFKRHPKSLTVFGLGAGSLTKFFFYFCPKSKIDTIEINPQVINVAFQMFEVPAETNRHKIIEMDASSYLNNQKLPFDVLISDIFDGYGIPKQFTQKRYFKKCYNSLHDSGIFVINLWGSDKNTPNFILDLKDLFNYVIIVESDNPGNIILFCFKSTFSFPPVKQMEKNLLRLSDKLNFDLKFFYKRMLKRNKQTFERIHCR